MIAILAEQGRTQHRGRVLISLSAVNMLFSFLLLGATAAAQSEAGGAALQGMVATLDGAPAVNAKVTSCNLETGYIRTSVTDAGGGFLEQAMPVGTYEVQATGAEGMVSRRIQVRLAVGASELVMLTIRPANERGSKLVVRNAQNTVETKESSVNSRVLNSFLEDTPMRGRAFPDFVQLTPNVYQEPDRNGLVIGGQRSINSNISIDGTDFNDPIEANQRGGNEPVFFFPLSAVREFQVVRAGANLEVGRTNAGFVNVVTKSGTNNWHGSTFYQNRNSTLSSRDAFNKDVNCALHQFGGSVGGPVRQDKILLFSSIEQNFLSLPFTVQYQPPTGVPLPSSFASSQGNGTATNNTTALFLRGDYILSHRHALNTQYTYARVDGRNFGDYRFTSTIFNQAESATYDRRAWSQGGKTSLISTFNPNLLNELRGQIAADDRREIPNLIAPLISVAGVGQIGGDASRPRLFDSTRYELADNVGWRLGKHSIRFGTDTNLTPEEIENENNIEGRYDFKNLNDYVAGKNFRYRGTLPLSGSPHDLVFTGRQSELAFFVQDKFELTRRLQIEGGLRWEGQWNPQPAKPNLAIPQTARIPNDLAQWQPRLGLAWDTTGKGRSVIRASAGIYDAYTPGILMDRTFTNNGQNLVTLDSNFDRNLLNYVKFPNALISVPPGITSAPPRVFGFDPKFRNPRSLQAGMAYGHAFDSGTVISIEYQHDSTWALQRLSDRNLSVPTYDSTGMPIFPSFRPNPVIGQLEINESMAHSTYDAAIFSVQQRMVNHLQFQGSYALGRNHDDDTNERNTGTITMLDPYRPAAESAPSNYDIRHNLNFSGIADLPHRFEVSAILLAHSGIPYTPIIGVDTQNDGNDTNDRAIINGRVAGRNSLRQDAFFDLDLRALKTWNVGEAKTLQLSAEVFNLTRNSNKSFGPGSRSVFGLPGAPSPTAGVALFAPSPVRFGGPRQVQMGLRYNF